ncbi:hypothetical protein [Streptomyces sp. NBC_00286]|uniref:hypothetical protein n=1 Tax=Streptomyces sp. NBC_00286 TaxID=2975701 RepID=UPI002E2A9FDA|nr:hypothetical protein [Streptomyces sp. NBC_00286]
MTEQEPMTEQDETQAEKPDGQRPGKQPGKQGGTLVWSRRVLPAAAAFTTLVGWTRAAVYASSRDDVVAAVHTSSQVTESARATVVQIQDALQYAWIGFPLVLVLLAFIAAVLKTGQALLIAISGCVGSFLAMAGLLFPSTGILIALAGAFLVGIIATVCAALLPGRT